MKIYWSDSSWSDCKNIECFLYFSETVNTEQTSRIFKALKDFQEFKEDRGDYSINNFHLCFPHALQRMKIIEYWLPVFSFNLEMLAPDCSTVHQYTSYNGFEEPAKNWEKYDGEFLDFFAKYV